MTLEAVIFDLDGVITDTAEYHFQAWKRLADEEGLPFDRALNERLRGVSRRESLQHILGGRHVDERDLQAMMARKNSYYVAMLESISPADLLPGAVALLDALDKAGIPCAIASASENAPAVVERLGLAQRFKVVAHGGSVRRQKPAPDLFRFTAAKLGVHPIHCLVVEDAAAGIEAAQAAGMSSLALGPAERFGDLLTRNGRTLHADSLADVTLADLERTATADPHWTVVQPTFEITKQHHMETVFTLGNGYFASRGSFEEGLAGERAATFAHGIYDDMPVSFTALVNMPNWLDLRLNVNGQHFRLDEGTVHFFGRWLDLRRGLLWRAVRWEAPDGTILDLTWERFASYTAEHVGALRFLATAVNRRCDLEVLAGIDGHVTNLNLRHWQILGQGDGAGVVWLRTRTAATKLDVATAATVKAEGSAVTVCQHCPGQPQFIITRSVEVGETLAVDKLVSYTASRDWDADERGSVARAQAALQSLSYDGLKSAQAAAWAELWGDCDVVIEGDELAQQALRFNLFQVLVAAPQRDERASIGAKTLSGYGYSGHVFWDTEIFILPFLIFTRPQIARNMLMYRYYTLAGARRKAAANGFRGAQFAWESAMTGDEMTPTWVPHFSDRTKLMRIWTGDIQIHISADIAYAIMQYWRATGDEVFLRDYGAEIILDTALFWGDRVEREETAEGHRYALRNVIGPDEYHDHIDNNAFTNRMAQWHLQTALQLLDWLKAHHPEKGHELMTQLHITEDDLAHWQDVIDHIIIDMDEETGLITQFEGFFERRPVDPAFIASADKSLQVILGIEGANESQVLKQADVVMLLCLLRDAYNAKVWQANWDAYMPLTDHRYGSSLGPSMHAWAACEMDKPEEAYQHFMLAATADLHNPRGNAGDGIHAASAGGVWQAAVFGFAGVRLAADGTLRTQPCLPPQWQRLAFTLRFHGRPYQIEILPDSQEVTIAKTLESSTLLS